MNITYKQTKSLNREQLENLYSDVGWTAYTTDMDLLQQALLQSLDVISAWDGERLIGLIRTVGDGLTILYIQDILVLGAYQNQGIATKLLQMAMQKHKTVRQKVLLTEEAPDVRHFYEKNGFESCDKGSAVAFGKFQ